MPFYNNGTIIFCTNERIVSKRFGRNPDARRRETPFRAWKLAYAGWNTKLIRPLETSFPEETVLCNPMFYFEGDLLQVTFLASTPNELGLDTHLYEMHGPSWNSLSEPRILSEEYTRTGFLSPRHICLGGDRELRLIDKTNGSRFKLTTSLPNISRVTFDPDNPARILITGMDHTEWYHTLVFNVDTNELLEFQGPAQMYKACLVGNRVVFSYRESEDIEDYQLCVAPLVLSETSETVALEPM